MDNTDDGECTCPFCAAGNRALRQGKLQNKDTGEVVIISDFEKLEQRVLAAMAEADIHTQAAVDAGVIVDLPDATLLIGGVPVGYAFDITVRKVVTAHEGFPAYATVKKIAPYGKKAKRGKGRGGY